MPFVFHRFLDTRVRPIQTLAFFLCLLSVLLPLRADDPIGPRETPRQFAPFAQQESFRIRIVNAVDGGIQVSGDAGQTWQLIGRVIAPATKSLMGYLASGYAPLSTVAATAVHGIRIRVGDLSRAYPQMINILPREFSQTPVRFGGLISGESGIYTNIPTGTAIFRDLSPYAGNPVFLQGATGDLTPLPVGYTPHENDILVIVVKRPANPLRQVVFQNNAGGKVTATYADGTQQVVTTVIKPVLGVGRFDGTSYTGVGALNTNHMGVITVSTAPITTSKLLEGVGPERRGGFQIEPAYHNSQTDEAGAPQILVVGSPDKKRTPDQEGTPPLFQGYFNLAWDPADPTHSWRAEIQRSGDTTWSPVPMVIGNQPNALAGVTAVRLVKDASDDVDWRQSRIAAAVDAYQKQSLAAASSGKEEIIRGQKSISIGVTDARTKFIVFYVDGAFKAMSNTVPYTFNWNTSEIPDGEYVLEARAEDENTNLVTATRTKVWIDNSGRFLK
jgi:hypothetical protein